MEERLILQDPSHGKKPCVCWVIMSAHYFLTFSIVFMQILGFSTSPTAVFVSEVNNNVFFDEA